MSHLSEHPTMKKLLDMSLPELKAISTQKEATYDSNGNLFFHFELIYNGTSGFITAKYNKDSNIFESVTLDLNFARPSGAYNYPELYKLAPKFLELISES